MLDRADIRKKIRFTSLFAIADVKNCVLMQLVLLLSSFAFVVQIEKNNET